MKHPTLDIDLNVNMDLNELFKSTFGEPIIDTNLSFEETFERFINDLPATRSDRKRLD